MNEMNLYRARENEPHVNLKRLGWHAFKAANWDLVLVEQDRSDVAASRGSDSNRKTVCLEVECSARHALENLRQNLEAGADYSLILAPDLKTLAAIAQRLMRESSPSHLARTGLLTPEVLVALFGSPAFSPHQSVEIDNKNKPTVKSTVQVQ